MTLHRPPADVEDFSKSAGVGAAALMAKWSSQVDDMMSSYDKNLFYNATTDTDPGVAAEPPGITWNAFPLQLEKLFSAQSPPQARLMAMKLADALDPLPVVRNDTHQSIDGYFRRRQDEYCEWHRHLSNGRGVRYTFSCENPEYWQFLHDNDPALLVDLYRQLLGRNDIQLQELEWPWDVTVDDDIGNYARGQYNRYNKWNTTDGIIHLTHRANTLGAEIDLAANATRTWPVTLGQSDDAQRLTCCSGWGNPNRSSDPNIGKGVFDLAATGLAITLAEPVGLYMSPMNLAGRLLAPDGKDIGGEAVRMARSSPDAKRILRMDVGVPAAATYALEDCTLDGAKLLFGGQLAKLITMIVFGAGKRIPGRTADVPSACKYFCCPHPKAPDYRQAFANKPNHPTCNDIPPGNFQPIPDPAAVPTTGFAHFEVARPFGTFALQFRLEARLGSARRLAD